MKDTTKTIIIGTVITLLVLFITLFILYKTSDKKEASNNRLTESLNTNTNLNNNSIPVSSETENDNNNDTNTDKEQEPSSIIDDNEANNKVILYMFHGITCPHCVNAINKIKEERNTTFKNVEIRTFEVWKNKDNNKLYQKVNEKLNVNVNSVPYFIIGEFNKVGFNADTLLKEYKNALNNKKYQDIVAEVIKENSDLNPVYETI